MNIFYLDKCPDKAARLQYNKHVVKMILESAQMLCADSESYGPFKAEDITTLPNEDAQKLISNNTATKIRIEE